MNLATATWVPNMHHACYLDCQVSHNIIVYHAIENGPGAIKGNYDVHWWPCGRKKGGHKKTWMNLDLLQAQAVVYYCLQKEGL